MDDEALNELVNLNNGMSVLIEILGEMRGDIALLRERVDMEGSHICDRLDTISSKVDHIAMHVE